MAIPLGTPESDEQGNQTSIPIPGSTPTDPIVLTESNVNSDGNPVTIPNALPTDPVVLTEPSSSSGGSPINIPEALPSDPIVLTDDTIVESGSPITIPTVLPTDPIVLTESNLNTDGSPVVIPVTLPADPLVLIPTIDISGSGSLGLTFGSAKQIPFVNPGGTDFLYDAAFIYNEGSNRLTVTNLTLSGVANISSLIMGGVTVDTIETILTNDATHIPTSSAVYAAIGAVVHGNHTGEVTSVGLVTTVDPSAITAKPEITSGLASTDELLLNDGGVLKRMDISVIESYMTTNLPFNLYVHPNHSGEITSVADGAQTLQATSITNRSYTAALVGGEDYLINDAGTLKKAGLAQMVTYFNSALTFPVTYVHPNHSGQVTSVSDGAQTLSTTAITDWSIPASFTGGENFLVEFGGTLYEMPQALIDTYLNANLNFNLYVHPNHTGQVLSVADGATALAINAITDQTNKLIGDIGISSELLIGTSGTLGRLDLSVLRDWMQSQLTFTTPYVHPNHSGQVTSTGDGATVVTVSAITAQTEMVTAVIGTDEMLISDGGVLKRLDVSVLGAYMTSLVSFPVDSVFGRTGAVVAQAGDYTPVQVINLGLAGEIPYMNAGPSDFAYNLSFKFSASTLQVPAVLATDVQTGTFTATTSGSIAQLFLATGAKVVHIENTALTGAADALVTDDVITAALAAQFYTHPNHSGQVTSVGDGATTLTSTAITAWTTPASVTGAENMLMELTGTLYEIPVGLFTTYLSTLYNNYTHPNHTGHVTSTGDGATVLTVAGITGQTELASGLISTDELLVNDGGVIKRMDVSVIEAYMQSNLAFDSVTWGTVGQVPYMNVGGTDFQYSASVGYFTGIFTVPNMAISALAADGGLLYSVIATGQVAQSANLTFDGTDLTLLGHLNTKAIHFDNAYTPATEPEGLMWWNGTDHSMNIATGLGSTIQVGEEDLILIYNNTGADLTNGKVVQVGGGSTGGNPHAEYAQADIFENCDRTIAIMTSTVTTGNIGFATVRGRVRDVPTSLIGFGQAYLSATVAGDITNTKPEFPNYAIEVGAVSVLHASLGEFTVEIGNPPEFTVHNFWNGVVRESFSFNVTSSGTVITGTLTNKLGDDQLTLLFSDGFTLLDVSTPPTITLAVGTSTVPVLSYIYIPISTKVLTTSTVGWPSTEHIKIATVIVRSAVDVVTDGAVKNHNWNDHIQGDDGQGHLSHMTQKLRNFEAQWESGSELSITYSAVPTPDSMTVQVTSGSVFQLHPQSVKAFDTSVADHYNVPNHFTTPYYEGTDLNELIADANGTNLNNSSFSFVFWGIANSAGEDAQLMINLPSGSYAFNSPELAVADGLNYSDYSIERMYQGTGFLIARVTFTYKNNAWVVYNIEDLRGKIPNTTAGGGTAGGAGATTFLGLLDTPATYVGAALQVATVNAGETALEFTTIAPSISFGLSGEIPYTNTVPDDFLYASGFTYISNVLTTPSLKITGLSADTQILYTTATGAVTSSSIFTFAAGLLSTLSLKLNTGATVDTIETILTDDDTHLPTSGAVIDAIAAVPVYTHPNHSGQVTSVGDGAQTLATTAITDWTTPASFTGGENFLVELTATLYEMPFALIETYLNANLAFNNYSHPNHSGQVTSSGDGAQTLSSTAISDWTIPASVTGAENLLMELSGTLYEIPMGLLETYLDTQYNLYTHPNHTGQVTSTGDGATVATISIITAQTELTSGIAATDELLINDGGVLKRVDITFLEAYMQSNLTFTTPYVHPNHSGQIDSIADGATAANSTLITAQTGTAGLIGGENFLIEDTATLKKLALAQLETYLNSNLSFNNYTHPNHTGQVTSSGDGATTLTSTAITAWTTPASFTGAENFLVEIAGTLYDMPQALITTYLNATLSFNNYTHPNHSGHIISVGDGVTVLQLSAITGWTSLTFAGALMSPGDDILITNSGVLKRLNLSDLGLYLDTTLNFNDYTHPNHSGEVTSIADGAQTVGVTAISNRGYVPSVTGAEDFLVKQGTGLWKASMAQMETYLNANLNFGSGSSDVSINGSTSNGVATYGGADTIDIESNLTFSGSTLVVGGSASTSQLTLDNTSTYSWFMKGDSDLFITWGYYTSTFLTLTSGGLTSSGKITGTTGFESTALSQTNDGALVTASGAGVGLLETDNALYWNGTSLVLNPGSLLMYSSSNPDARITFATVAASAAVYYYDEGTASFLDFRFGTNTANSGIYWDEANSRVGILDDTPSYTLDVNGTGRFTGEFITDDIVGINGATTATVTLAVTGGTADVRALQLTNNNTTFTTWSDFPTGLPGNRYALFTTGALVGGSDHNMGLTMSARGNTSGAANAYSHWYVRSTSTTNHGSETGWLLRGPGVSDYGTPFKFNSDSQFFFQAEATTDDIPLFFRHGATTKFTMGWDESQNAWSINYGTALGSAGRLEMAYDYLMYLYGATSSGFYIKAATTNARFYLDAYTNYDSVVYFRENGSGKTIMGYDTGINAFQIHTSTAFTTLAAADFSISDAGYVYMGNLRSVSNTNYLRHNTSTGEVTYYSSDRALKHNIRDMEDDALTVLQQFKPRTFEWNDDGHTSNGWIAQEGVDHILNMFPMVEKTGLYTISEGEILPFFHKGILQLNAKQETHEEKIKRLTDRVTELENKLAKY